MHTYYTYISLFLIIIRLLFLFVPSFFDVYLINTLLAMKNLLLIIYWLYCLVWQQNEFEDIVIFDAI